jgi:hypothetical protein
MLILIRQKSPPLLPLPSSPLLHTLVFLISVLRGNTIVMLRNSVNLQDNHVVLSPVIITISVISMNHAIVETVQMVVKMTKTNVDSQTVHSCIVQRMLFEEKIIPLSHSVSQLVSMVKHVIQLVQLKSEPAVLLIHNGIQMKTSVYQSTLALALKPQLKSKQDTTSHT